MKIKFLALAMIAMLFTACKPDPQPDGGDGSGTNNGDVESSYIAISLASSDSENRGDDSTKDYLIGEDYERVVKSAHVFFFTDGEPFVGVSSPRNYQTLPLAEETPTSDMPNISDIHESVLVIENYTGELPNQMVAVLNWTPVNDKYSLDQLKGALVEHINNLGGTDCFVMSNSVYKNDAGLVYATPLDITNFYNKDVDALANPVKVYVERVAAKVIVKTNGDIDDDQPSTEDAHIFKLQTSKTDDNPILIGGKEVYAKIIGWDLYNDYATSNLIKNIDNYTLGINWNDPNNFRSYWATCTGATMTDAVDYDGIATYHPYLYCGENTRGNTAADLRTQIVFKAQLQDVDGKEIEVAKWFGNDYIGKEQLLAAVKSTISNTYYSSTDGSKYTSIGVGDLMTVAGGDGDGGKIKAYQVYFQLSNVANQGVNKTWYKLVGGEFKSISVGDLNDELKAYITPALLYADGMTYYITDIEHLKSQTTTTYGVVRNHIYDINIKSISGLGTPVADETITITKPETPEEEASTYVAAEINILSWRLITNDVDL